MSKYFLVLKLPALFLWFGILNANNVHGAIVTTNFQAVVGSVNTTELATLGINVAVGDLMSGSVSYDLTAIDTISTANQGHYWSSIPPSAMSYTVGNYSFLATSPLCCHANAPPNTGMVVSVLDNPSSDILSISGTTTLGPNDVQTNLRLFDSTGTVFSDDSLPTEPFTNLAFDRSLFRLFRIGPSGNNPSVAFTVFEANLIGGVSVIPIPAALPLFVSALAALGFVGWRRRRS